MIPIDKQTLFMVATIVALAATVYLFKEMKKTKEDLDSLKGVSSKVVRHLNQLPPPRAFVQMARAQADDSQRFTDAEEKQQQADAGAENGEGAAGSEEE
jgi:hypothetical protein